jgi:hypothetical protein
MKILGEEKISHGKIRILKKTNNNRTKKTKIVKNEA